MLKKYDVLCIGSATVDNFLTTNCSLKCVHLGDKILVTHMEKHSGGGATNSAAVKVKLLTKLGNDHDAEFITKELKQYKLKNICLHTSNKNTNSSTLISCPQDKDRIIYAHKGASSDLSLNDFKKSQLSARWIYMASLMDKSFQTAKKIVLHAKKNKINLLFNPSLYLAKKGKAQLKSILEATTILVLNKEEAQALLKNKTGSFKKLLLELEKLGPETVIITNGAKKCYALSENVIYSLTPPDVKIVHTAGAGDAFTAGFLAGIIKKYSLEDALRLGQVNSSSVIQHFGTKNKLLSEKEAKLFMERYKIKINKNEI